MAADKNYLYVGQTNSIVIFSAYDPLHPYSRGYHAAQARSHH